MSAGLSQAVESAGFLFLINSLGIAFASLDELAIDLPPTPYPRPPSGSVLFEDINRFMVKVKIRLL